MIKLQKCICYIHIKFVNVINSAQQKKDKNTYDLKARRMVFDLFFFSLLVNFFILIFKNHYYLPNIFAKLQFQKMKYHYTVYLFREN